MSRIFILNVFIFIFTVILAVESIDDQQKRTNWNKAVGLWGKRSKFDDAVSEILQMAIFHLLIFILICFIYL